MTSPLVSVIILTHNRTDEVREALVSIFAQDYPRLEVILLDNGSTDGSPAALKESFPDITLVSLPENIIRRSTNLVISRTCDFCRRGEYHNTVHSVPICRRGRQ